METHVSTRSGEPPNENDENTPLLTRQNAWTKKDLLALVLQENTPLLTRQNAWTKKDLLALVLFKKTPYR